jgi:polysaccharide export outer membrane protein
MVIATLLFALLARAGDSSRADGLGYRVGPGDELTIEVVGESEMSGTFRIADDGAVDIPFGGRVLVDALTLDEAIAVVTQHLGTTVLRRPQVVMSVARFHSREVEVSGAVAKPGKYPLTEGVTTVREMLLAAGGLGDVSSPRAEIHRDGTGGRQVIDIDLERVYNGDPLADVEVLPGDQLFVPPAASVYVDGHVGKPGAIAYRDGMTLMQAIAQAGSTLGTARAAGVYILRGSERLPVNVRRIQRGDDADVALRPGDRVFVPESAF